MRVDTRITAQTIIEGYDRQTGWFQPRIGWIAPRTALLTMTRNHLWGSDIFTAVHTMRSDDVGATWSPPEPRHGLTGVAWRMGMRFVPVI